MISTSTHGSGSPSVADMLSSVDSGSAPEISVVIGTKAQYIKTAPLLRHLTSRGVDYRLIDTGQHAALSPRLRSELGVKDPDVLLGDSSNVKTVRQAAIWAIRILWMVLRRGDYLREQVFRPGPGYCIIHGDTPSTLLALAMAKRARKTVVHLEAGLRSFRHFSPFPEEIIRIICMHFSDVLFAPSRWALDNLRSMRVRGHCIELAQNTNIEAIHFALAHGDRSLVPPESFAVMTVHRVETLMSKRRLRVILEIAQEIARKRLLIFVMHDPTAKKLADYGLLEDLKRIQRIRMMPLLVHSQFVPLLAAADFVITDGGSIQEETHYLDVPCLVIRGETERMEGIGGNVKLVGFDPKLVRQFVAECDRRGMRTPVRNLEPSRHIAEFLLNDSLSTGRRAFAKSPV